VGGSAAAAIEPTVRRCRRVNIGKLAQNVGRLLRLRPIPHRRQPDGLHLPDIDEPWRLDEILQAPTRLRLVNPATGHFVELESDNVREYRSPDHLILRCQLTLRGRHVDIEPLVPSASPVLPSDADWRHLYGQMPGLLDEIRSDLAAYPTRRDIVLLKKAWTFWPTGSELVYYHDEHPELRAHFQALVGATLATDLSTSKLERFRLSESLVARLRG
jgi:hypothetical protein